MNWFNMKKNNSKMCNATEEPWLIPHFCQNCSRLEQEAHVFANGSDLYRKKYCLHTDIGFYGWIGEGKIKPISSSITPYILLQKQIHSSFFLN